LSLLVATAA